MRHTRLYLAPILFALLPLASWCQEKRKVIIDQDAAGPAGTGQQSILMLLQSRETDVLGITVVTGDAWLREEVAHTLRMLELVGRTDVPVFPGAEYPLVRRKETTELWEQRYGMIAWLGAWTPGRYHPPDEYGDMPEGRPTTRPAREDAPHFLIRMVHQYPHQVTLYAGGPMTNLALAVSIDPGLPALAKELVFMGASLSPQTEDPEFQRLPHHEFNIWFDPEAAHIVLRAPWKKMVATPVDISIKTELTRDLIDRVKKSDTPSARYIGSYAALHGKYNYLWDELAAAAWLDPSVITRKETRYMDVDLESGAGYGNTLTWPEKVKPRVQVQPVEIEEELDREKFYNLFVALLSAPTPKKAGSVSKLP